MSVSPLAFGAITGVDDTAVIRACMTYANAAHEPVSFAGIDTFAIEADAQISINTSVDFAGAKWVIRDGIVASPDFIYQTAFIVADPGTPLVSGIVPTNATDFVAGSTSPSASFWTDPGFLYFQGDALGPQVASRDRTSLLSYRQSFCIVKDGRVIYPLEVDMTSAAEVYFRARRNPKRGWITISGVSVEVSQINNQQLFRINRNMVRIDRPHFYGENTLPVSINALIAVIDCAHVTLDGGVAEAQTNPSSGSYIYSISNAAEIGARDFVCTNGWGWQGCSNTSGIYLDNCRINRFDCHNGGFNMFVRNSHFVEHGIRIGWGGGMLKTDGCTTSNCDLVNSRVDYGAYWFGVFDLSDTVLNRDIGSTATVVNFQTEPVGCEVLPLPLPRSIRVAGIHRGKGGSGNQYIAPVRIAIKEGAQAMVAPEAVSVSDVSGESGASSAQAVYNVIDVNNMTGNRVNISISNINPGRALTASDVAAGRTLLHSPAKTGSHTPPSFTALIKDVNLAVLDVSGVECSPRVEMRGCGGIGRAKGAAGGRFLVSACGFIGPVLLSGETASPVGGVRAGTYGISTVQASTLHGAWDLTDLAMMSGLVWPASQDANISLPAGATPATAMSGWRAAF